MQDEASAQRVNQRVQETLTYYAYPSTHWRQIKINNPLERIIGEIGRPTGVVGKHRGEMPTLKL